MYGMSSKWFPWSLAIGSTLAIGFGVAIVISGQNSDRAATRRNGVEQVSSRQEWPEFTAQEITNARGLMAASPTALNPGEQQAIILRSVVAYDKSTYGCPAWGNCWVALVILSGDRKPLQYRLLYAYGDNLALVDHCFKTGDRVALNWAAMQAPGDTGRVGENTVISDLGWLRPITPVHCPG